MRTSTLIISLMVLLSLCSASAQDRSTARSMVISKYGIVATSYVQASQAGAEVLRIEDGRIVSQGAAAVVLAAERAQLLSSLE